jgi:hypothetical protein
VQYQSISRPSTTPIRFLQTFGFYIFSKDLIKGPRCVSDRFAILIAVIFVATNQTNGRSLLKLRAFSGQRGA